MENIKNIFDDKNMEELDENEVEVDEEYEEEEYYDDVEEDVDYDEEEVEMSPSDLLALIKRSKVTEEPEVDTEDEDEIYIEDEETDDSIFDYDPFEDEEDITGDVDTEDEELEEELEEDSIEGVNLEDFNEEELEAMLSQLTEESDSEEFIEESPEDIRRGMEEDQFGEDGRQDADTLYDLDGNPVLFQTDGKIYTADINIDDILVPPRSRKNHRQDLDELEKSIMQWGLVSPLHVIPFGGKYVLVHGLRRLQAMKNLKFETCLCIVDETRPKTTVRFLEVINNNAKKYNFFEMLDFGSFIETKQKTFKHETIENIIGMDAGDYMRAKIIRAQDRFGIIEEIFKGKKSIKEGEKKLNKELEKEEKERIDLEMQGVDDRGLPNSYADFIEEEANLQEKGKREPLPSHVVQRLRARDKSTCQSCGLGHYEPELTSVFESHHIVRVADKGNDHDNNLITLCANCHKVVHSYAEGKFNPSQDRIKHYNNVIVLGNIIRNGIKDGKTAYGTYMEESSMPWLD